jgi:hypothetical protein
MQSAVGDNHSPDASDLLGAAERLLDKVLRSECESRASALDLLTVDALMTRSMEEAAKDPRLLEDFPELAIRTVSSIRVDR